MVYVCAHVRVRVSFLTSLDRSARLTLVFSLLLVPPRTVFFNTILVVRLAVARQTSHAVCLVFSLLLVPRTVFF